MSKDYVTPPVTVFCGLVTLGSLECKVLQMPNWPLWYPPMCPPNDAVPSAGNVYRVIKHNEPNLIDFETTLEREFRLKGNRAWKEEDVRDASVSVMQTLSDAEKLRGIFPEWRRRKIAVGSIDGAGVMKHSPDEENGIATHHDWWREAVDHAWRTFTVVPSSAVTS